MNYQLCDNQKTLDMFLSATDGESRIALDLEGESNLHRYGIHLCLAQVALESGQIFLLDPMALGSSFQQTRDVLSNPELTKVMFSPDFDVRLLHHAAGIELKGIFDLQLAAKWAGFEKTGLDSILTALGLGGADLGKEDQTSDWTQRPLTEKQLQYAAGDVVDLLAAHDTLGPRVADLGKVADFAREMAKMESLRFQNGVLSHGFRKKLRNLPRHLIDLAEALYWEREKIAERLDVPPFKVVSNDLLVYLAKTRPRGERDWAKVKGFNPRARGHLGPLKKAIEEFAARPS